MKSFMWALAAWLLLSAGLAGCGGGWRHQKPAVTQIAPPVAGKPTKALLQWGPQDAKVRLIGFFYISPDRAIKCTSRCLRVWPSSIQSSCSFSTGICAPRRSGHPQQHPPFSRLHRAAHQWQQRVRPPRPPADSRLLQSGDGPLLDRRRTAPGRRHGDQERIRQVGVLRWGRYVRMSLAACPPSTPSSCPRAVRDREGRLQH